MPLIELTTVIHAPISRCFDLSRSIDLHILSTEGTEEEAIAGVTSGLVGDGDQVTWRAKHFGISHVLTTKITAYHHGVHFRDEMVQGIFKLMCHDHFFEASSASTIMKDKFVFESPGGVFGLLFNKLILENYMRKFLLRRNDMIKAVAESGEWKQILKQE